MESLHCLDAVKESVCLHFPSNTGMRLVATEGLALRGG